MYSGGNLSPYFSEMTSLSVFDNLLGGGGALRKQCEETTRFQETLNLTFYIHAYSLDPSPKKCDY